MVGVGFSRSRHAAGYSRRALSSVQLQVQNHKMKGCFAKSAHPHAFFTSVAFGGRWRHRAWDVPLLDEAFDPAYRWAPKLSVSPFHGSISMFYSVGNCSPRKEAYVKPTMTSSVWCEQTAKNNSATFRPGRRLWRGATKGLSHHHYQSYRLKKGGSPPCVKSCEYQYIRPCSWKKHFKRASVGFANTSLLGGSTRLWISDLWG